MDLNLKCFVDTVYDGVRCTVYDLFVIYRRNRNRRNDNAQRVYIFEKYVVEFLEYINIVINIATYVITL